MRIPASLFAAFGVLFPSLLSVMQAILSFSPDVRSSTAFKSPEAPPGQNQLQHQDYRLKVSVDLVLVDVTVRGNPSRELRLEDFAVYDNLLLQEATHFSRDQLPLKIALVVDVSGSIQPYKRELENSVKSVINALNPGDQVALFSFSTQCRKLCDLTRDDQKLAALIRNLSLGGGTDICGAVLDAVRYLYDNTPDHRRAVILISDNQNTISSNTQNRARESALAAATSVYGIEITDPEHPAGQPGSSRPIWSSCSVYDLAEGTGGEILHANAAGKLSGALEQSIANIRMQYTLGFVPSNMGERGSYHNLTVKLRDANLCKDCQLVARKGYYSGIPAFFNPETQETETMPAWEDIETAAYDRITAAAGNDSDLNDISFKIKTGKTKDAAGKPQINVDLKIDPDRIGFSRREELHTCRLHIAFFYGDSYGSYLGHIWRTMDLQLQEQDYRNIMKSTIPYSTAVPVYVKKQFLKAIVYDVETDKVGSRTIIVR